MMVASYYREVLTQRKGKGPALLKDTANITQLGITKPCLNAIFNTM